MIIIEHSKDTRIPERSALISINNQRIEDFLEFEFYNDTTMPRQLVIDACGKKQCLEFRPHEDIPVTFQSPQYRTCENNCAFCFIKGLPPGLRKELYVRDDDYRLSFLFGNFLSLTNITNDDIKRIARLKLSPLYVSVHATEPHLRRRLFANERAAIIMEQLQALIDHSIKIHCQIVVIPGINDGIHLERSIDQLSSLYPGVASIGVVPVGCTQHMKNVCLVSPEQARAIVSYISAKQENFRKQYNYGLVYAADELFIKSGIRIPSEEYYDNMPQIENGIGMMRSFFKEVQGIRTKKKIKGRVLMITSCDGVRCVETLKHRYCELDLIDGTNLEIMIVSNRFLGKSVTVSGLICAQDINSTLSACGRRFDRIVLPPNCTNDHGKFLDNGNITTQVHVAPHSLKELTKWLQS